MLGKRRRSGGGKYHRQGHRRAGGRARERACVRACVYAFTCVHALRACVRACVCCKQKRNFSSHTRKSVDACLRAFVYAFICVHERVHVHACVCVRVCGGAQEEAKHGEVRACVRVCIYLRA